MPLNQKNKEIEQLKKENARLKAALNDSDFECQRLSLINNNLEIQLAEANRELETNIQVLQNLKNEIGDIVDKLKVWFFYIPNIIKKAYRNDTPFAMQLITAQLGKQKPFFCPCPFSQI